MPLVRPELHRGGEVGAYFLAGKLRLGAGVDRFAGAGQLDSWIAQVGIADINGLIYWGVRHARAVSGRGGHLQSCGWIFTS